MKKRIISLLVVDLSTSSATAGARIIPLANYFIQNRNRVSFLINSVTKKTYLSLLGPEKQKISITTFPFSNYFLGGKIFVGLEYLKRVLIAPFIGIDKNTDVIYSLTGIICDVFPSFVFKLRTKKIWVANVDNIEAPPSQKPGSYIVNLFSYLLFRLSVFLLRWADAIFITTPLKEVKDTLIRSGISPERVFLSNNGIPFDYVQKIKKPKTPKYSAAFMGRIHKGKGVFDLIKAWAKVVKKFGQKENLLVLGSGDKETTTKLQGAISKEGLRDKVVLAGFVKEKRKYQLLKSSKIFLYPSYYDANPISTVEALACGLPVVAYDLPIFVEHYPKNIIEIVSKGDIDQFSLKVINLLTDRVKMKMMTAAGMKWARNSNWEEIFRKQEKIIRCLKK